jgi:hypothetical protein
MLSNVVKYNLVIYSDEASSEHLQKYLSNERIKLIIKPYTEFYNYKYKDYFIKNHEINLFMKDKVDWRVNMLWCEKNCFVDETIKNKYFDTDYYGWCDIGYFRCNNRHIPPSHLQQWPNPEKIDSLDKEKIYYALVNNDNRFIQYIYNVINDKNELGLPRVPIVPYQISVGGGFYIMYKDKIDWWRTIFDNRLLLYFENNYLVKDDQIIVADCVFSNISNFNLCREDNPHFDNWFLFQRFLL